MLSGNEIGTGIENRFLGKKDRKLQMKLKPKRSNLLFFGFVV